MVKPKNNKPHTAKFMKNFYKLNRKQKQVLIATMGLIVVVYYLNRHHFRPYIYNTCDNDMVIFFFGIFPNIIGIINIFLFSRYFFDYSVLKSILYSIVLAIAFEYLHYIQGATFDWNDIIASAITLVFCYVFSKEH